MTIGEISEKFNLTHDTLRYYERIGLIQAVNRNKNGIRNYTEQDCKWIQFIKCMRAAGLPIEVLIEYVTLFQKGDETAMARKELLVEQRRLLMDRIDEMSETLGRLNRKIDRYNEVLIPKMNALKTPVTIDFE